MIPVDLAGASARGPAERGRARPVLANVNLQAERGVLAVLGAYKDGTGLLLDLIDGTTTPSAGKVVVLGSSPEKVRARVARVSLEAPLPEALCVEEVCELAADLRGEPRRAASEVLGKLGIANLANRRVRTLSLEERRTVALAIALSSTKVEVLLVEEPLAALDPVAPRQVVEALRARGAEASVIVTTASARDATRIADRLGVLTAGVYTPMGREDAHMGLGKEAASMRVVVAPSAQKPGVASLVAALSGDPAVVRVETSSFAASAGGTLVSAWGPSLPLLSKAVTRAIAGARVEVELVEPSTLPLDALRAAMAARAASPPLGSLPPPPRSLPPSVLPPYGPPIVPGSIPPPGPPASIPPSSVPPSRGGA